MEDRQQLDLPAEEPAFLPEDLEPRPFTPPARHRVLGTLTILSVLILLAVIPPLVHVNQFQRQIVQSISQSLGRPVHAGEVTLNLLPFPGFTLQNFVVSDDPSFGSEPVIRASSVMARLRWRSLWRRRVEFSRITLADASVNLVRRADGQWNLESILLQASRMPAAPTGQRGPGDRARFPYIEATGARINVKMGLEKLPVSLTEADFALWLPQAELYRLRLEARPARTDAAVTDTGVVRLEGSLGRAVTLADVPVDLHASWTGAPLGAASTVATGRDMGFRGEMTFNVTLKGTAGSNAVESRLQLDRVRRADFVPARLMEVDIACTAQALANLHRLEQVHCAWPAGGSSSGLDVTGEIPDTLHPASADLQATVQALPAANMLDALRLLTPQVSSTLALGGTLAGHFTCCKPSGGLPDGNFTLSQAVLGSGSDRPFAAGNLTGSLSQQALQLDPVPLDLGGPTPAQLRLGLTAGDYTMSVEGPAQRTRLAAFATAFPLLGTGLADTTPDADGTQIVQLARSSHGSWGEPQKWNSPEVVRPNPAPRKRHR